MAMKVRPREDKAGWLDRRSVYTVLAVETTGENEILLRIESENAQTPALFPAKEFELLDDSIPSIWTISIEPSGTLDLRPVSWRRPGFWEDFFDGDMTARQLYEQARDAILAD